MEEPITNLTPASAFLFPECSFEPQGIFLYFQSSDWSPCGLSGVTVNQCQRRNQRNLCSCLDPPGFSAPSRSFPHWVLRNLFLLKIICRQDGRNSGLVRGAPPRQLKSSPVLCLHFLAPVKCLLCCIAAFSLAFMVTEECHPIKDIMSPRNAVQCLVMKFSPSRT
jgi:hypothetical protein